MTARIIAPLRPGVRGYQIVAVPNDEAGGRTDEAARSSSVLTVAGYTPLVPPGVDLLEIGVVTCAGRYDLLPVDMGHRARWTETIRIWVTDSMAARQKLLVEQRYRTLLESLPNDAHEVDEWVMAARQRGEIHPVFGALSRATLELWQEHLLGRGARDDTKPDQLDQRVADRAASLIHPLTYAFRIDQESLGALVAEPAQCLWHCIHACLAEGEYDAATIRAIARLKRAPACRLPALCVEPLLRSVEDLDIFFALIRHAPDLFDHLAIVLLRWSLCPSPMDADIVVRVLYAAWMSLEVGAATDLIRNYLPCIARQPISRFGRSLSQWLAIQVDAQAALGVRSVHVWQPLEALQDVVDVANRAFRRSVDDIVTRFPVRLDVV